MISALLTPKVIGAAGAVLLILALFTWHTAKVNQAYEQGRLFERQEAIRRADELNKEREKNSAEISKMPPDQLVCELTGGVFARGKCRY